MLSSIILIVNQPNKKAKANHPLIQHWILVSSKPTGLQKDITHKAKVKFLQIRKNCFYQTSLKLV